MPDEPGSHGDAQGSTKHEHEPEGAFSLFTEARRHPGATVALALCILAGAVLAALMLPESISLPRRIVGGAVMGGLSWLLVMVGRIIGG